MSTAAAVRERGILFSAPMVRKILAGEKTQTRRVIRLPKDPPAPGVIREISLALCPHGQADEFLYVREAATLTWGAGSRDGFSFCLTYRADLAGRVFHRADFAPFKILKWTLGIHCPRWASRIQLKVVYVRAEPLQDITEEDAKAEGMDPWSSGVSYLGVTGYRGSFADTWNRLNADRGHGWATNPWVWAITFSKAETAA